MKEGRKPEYPEKTPGDGLHGRYERVWLNTLHVISNAQVFALDPYLTGSEKPICV